MTARIRARHQPVPLLLGTCAAFLLLVTPFASFLQFHGYGFTRPEVLACLAVLAAASVLLGAAMRASPVAEALTLAALLTIAADIQFHPPKGSIGLGLIFLVCVAVLRAIHLHASRITALVAATVLGSSLLIPGQRAPDLTPMPHRPGADLPLVLHVVLDEYIGVEGLPADLAPPGFASGLRSFYDRRGFLVFGSAYSEYFNTYRSIGQLVNVSPGGFVESFYTHLGGDEETSWQLRQNAYFEALAKRGYSLRVYQSDYLDVCSDSTAASTACQTYASTTLRALAPVALPWPTKVPVVAGMYLDRSTLYTNLRRYYRMFRKRLMGSGVRLPAWNWERSRINPLSSMPVLEAVRADLTAARRGDFIFAHLLIPHYPYVFDAACSPRRPVEWLDRMDNDAPAGRANTRESRALRYGRYFDQVACVQRKLDQLLAAIPSPLRDDAIVIVQGDHGSRIAFVEPRLPTSAALSPGDYADSYSTLFAVRAPGLPAGYDARAVAITCLMRTLVANAFESLAGLESCPAPRTVFMYGTNTSKALPLPPFGREAVRADLGAHPR